MWMLKDRKDIRYQALSCNTIIIFDNCYVIYSYRFPKKMLEKYRSSVLIVRYISRENLPVTITTIETLLIEM